MYYLGHQGSRWIGFSKQKNREFKLKYLQKPFDNNNILCLQEVHGRDEYLQAIQVLAPRFRFLGTFIPGNENVGGSVLDTLSNQRLNPSSPQSWEYCLAILVFV